MLHAQLDRERERFGRAECRRGEPRVEAALEPRQPLIVDARITDQMSEQGAVGVDPTFAIEEGKTRKAQAVDLVFLLRRQMAFDPDEPPLTLILCYPNNHYESDAYVRFGSKADIRLTSPMA